MRLKLVFWVLACLLSMVCCGQNSIDIPKEYVAAAIPYHGFSEWTEANQSPYSFAVNKVDGKLEVTRAKYVSKCEYILPNGSLMGYDYGEFGGGLYFYNNDSCKAILIKAGNIKAIFSYKNKLFFLDGISHMGYKRGGMYMVELNDRGFTYKLMVDLEDSPEACVIANDLIYIITSGDLLVIHNFQKLALFSNQFWAGLYPNSLALFDASNLFVGMRSGITKLDLIARKMTYYKYNLEYNTQQ